MELLERGPVSGAVVNSSLVPDKLTGIFGNVIKQSSSVTEKKTANKLCVLLPTMGPHPTHPFMNHLVLRKTFVHLSVEDLSTCRLVSHLWHVEATPFFRSRAQVTLKGRPHRLLSCYSDRPKTLEDFVNVIQSSWLVPFSRFTLVNLSLKHRDAVTFLSLCSTRLTLTHLTVDLPSLRHVNLTTFWSLLSSTAHSLMTLDIDMLPSEVMNSLEESGCPTDLRCPALKQIIFPSCRFPDGFSGKFIRDLILVSPNLEHVSTNSFDQTFPLLLALRERSVARNLTKLRLEELRNRDLGALIELSHRKTGSLSLSEFKFLRLVEDVPGRELDTFLQSQSRSLKVLAMGDIQGTRHLFLHLWKPLELLENLCLVPNSRNKIFFQEVCYRTQFPALKSLEVSTWSNMWQEYFPAGSNVAPCLTLTSLHVALKVPDEGLVTRLAHMFPKVKRLKFDFPSTKTLIALWKAWPALEELTLHICKAFDCHIDGLLTGKPKSPRNVSVDSAVNEFPGIANLKELKRLCLEVVYCVNKCCPTDEAVQGAFVHMTNLREITITRSQITREGLQAMWDSLPYLMSMDIRGPKGPGTKIIEEEKELRMYSRMARTRAE